MKVDLGACAVCGAKNSKFVEVCYKCGAPLPWAPNYVAPKTPEPKPAPAQPIPTPAPTSGTKTVVIPSDPVSPSAPADLPSGSKLDRVPRRVQAPTWALALGVVGCVALGMILVTVFGRGSKNPSTQPVVVPTPVTAPTQTDNAVATNAVATNAAPVPVVAPTSATPAISPTPAPTVENVKLGPSFSEVDAKMNARNTTSTEAQKDAYWQSVVGSQVTWQGKVVEVRSKDTGQIILHCGSQNPPSEVQVSLDGTQLGDLAAIGKKNMITIQGILQGHSEKGYSVERAKIVNKGS